MTEDEAQDWLRENLRVSRETMELLGAVAAMVTEESTHQNLISAATVDHIWARHIVDSAQLLTLATDTGAAGTGAIGVGAMDASDGVWMDLGTGAGFPGVVIAALDPDRSVLLVESRRKRIDFLERMVTRLGLTNASVYGGRLEDLADQKAAIISARAFAPLPKLFTLSQRFSGNGTIWLLPKGRSASQDLESAKQSWQGVFHVKQSVTDRDAAIIVAQRVQRKRAR